MIIEDERHTYLGANDFDYDQINDNGPEPVSHNPTCNLMQFIECHNSIRDREIILNFKQISLSIYGNYKASCRNL